MLIELRQAPVSYPFYHMLPPTLTRIVFREEPAFSRRSMYATDTGGLDTWRSSGGAGRSAHIIHEASGPSSPNKPFSRPALCVAHS